MTAPIGIYVRVSRQGDREDERFHSPREQAERAAGLVTGRGFVPGPVFEDIDVSGATAPADRPAMGLLLKAVLAGELGGIAAYSLDRLSREPVHGDALVKAVTKAGGVILTPDIPEAIDSPTGEFTFGMLLQVAKLYRSQAGARWASAKERSILAGIPVARTPIGYRPGTDRRIEIDPVTGPAVREAYERRAAGASWAEVGRILTEASGTFWSRQAAAHVLRNRIYATGRLEHSGVVSEHSAGALVDEPLWHAVQRAEPGPRPKRNPDSLWLLTGLLRCALCGRSLWPWSGSARGRRSVPRRYKCPNEACARPRLSVEANRLESWVVAQTFALGDAMVTRSEAPDLGALEDAVATAERRLAQVLAPEARDALGGLWAADVKARRAERDDALARLGGARELAGVSDSEFRLREVWEDLAPEARRAALSLFWREIRLGRRGPAGTPVTLVARGPQAEVEVTLPTDNEADPAGSAQGGTP